MSNNEHPYIDEKPIVNMDENGGPSLDHSFDPGTPKDGDQWRSDIDPLYEKRILRKLDLHLLPFLCLLFLLSFL